MHVSREGNRFPSFFFFFLKSYHTVILRVKTIFRQEAINQPVKKNKLTNNTNVLK